MSEPTYVNEKKMANGFIFGLISIILTCCCSCIPFAGWLVLVAALVFAIISLVQSKKYKKAGLPSNGQLVAGKVLSIISIVINAINILVTVVTIVMYGFTYLMQIFMLMITALTSGGSAY